MKNYRKTILGTLVVASMIGGSNINSYANINEVSLKDVLENSNKTTEEILNIPGLSQILSYKKGFKPFTITKGLNGDSFYGYPMFSEVNVIGFIKWIMKEEEVYRDLFDNIEELDDLVGTDKFDDLWKKASDIDEYKFTLLQQTYIQNTVIEPLIQILKQKTGIDISEHRGLQEALYNTTTRLGVSRAYSIFKELLDGYSSIEDIDFKEFLSHYYIAKKDAIKKVKLTKVLSEKKENKSEEDLVKQTNLKLIKELDNEIEDLEDIYRESISIKIEKLDDKIKDLEYIYMKNIDIKNDEKLFNPFKSVSDFISNLFK